MAGIRTTGTYYFRPPDGNFVSPHYVIFDKTDNPYAIAAKKAVVMNWESLMQVQKQELSELLSRIATVEREKEIDYVKGKLPDMFADGFDEKTESISGYINKILSSEKQIDAIINDKKAGMGTAYKRSFDKYLQKYFKQMVEGKRGSINLVSDEDFMSKAMSMDEIVEGYIRQAIDTSDTDEGRDFITNFVGQMKDELLSDLKKVELFKDVGHWFEAGIDNQLMKITPSEFKKILQVNEPVIDKKTGKTTKDTARKAIDRIVKTGFKRGIALEWQVYENKIRLTDGFHTGGINGKADVILIDALENYNVSIPNNIYDSLEGSAREKILQILNRIQSNIKEVKTFILEVSAKDYMSHRGRQIMSSNFKNSVGRLKIISEQLGEHFDLDTFAFNLNNIVTGAFNSNRKEEVMDEIGMLCVAYMFDDIEAIFSETEENHDNVLHLYNLNGIYMTLSDLLLSVSKDISTINTNGLVKVTISEDKTTIPSMLEEYSDSYNSGIYPGLDGLLKRWDKVRDQIEENSTITIDFRYDTILQASQALQYLLRGG